MEFEELKKHMKDLMKSRDEMEEEIEKLQTSLGDMKVGVSSPLVDKNGYPIPNLNLVSVREKRNRFARLQTDYSRIMKEIEDGLVQLHSLKKVDSPRTPKAKKNDIIIPEKVFDPPFLLVDEVFSFSPAEEAGLIVGDEITNFGEIRKIDIEKYGLKSLGSYVKNNKNRKLSVGILRRGKVLNLDFIPRVWKGRGLLGCHVKPL